MTGSAVDSVALLSSLSTLQGGVSWFGAMLCVTVQENDMITLEY